MYAETIGGRSVLVPKSLNSMLKPALRFSMQFSIYRGGIDKKSR